MLPRRAGLAARFDHHLTSSFSSNTSSTSANSMSWGVIVGARQETTGQLRRGRSV